MIVGLISMSFDASFTLNTILPLAQTAYDLKFLPHGWEVVGKLEPSDFGYLLKNETAFGGLQTVLCIAFRGTEHEQEWLKDFDAVPVPALYGSPGHVHRGIQNQYSLIHTSLWTIFNSFGQFDELLVEGHSLGGGLAQLCAREMAKFKPRVWTFESPRVFWVDAASEFDQLITEYWRIENDAHDIVCHLPTTSALYRSVGTGIVIDGGFTSDAHVAHALDPSVRLGLQRLIDRSAK
jgi:triacylglycerol lipase